MGMQAMARWLGGGKKVALLLALLAATLAAVAATLAAVAALGVAASAASAATFSNNSGITINNGGTCDRNEVSLETGTATPYPSPITVSGLGSSISDVNVTVSGLSHTFPDDIGLLLVSPAGQSVILMTENGDAAAVSNVDLTFDDEASAGALPDTSQISSGTYLPSRGTSTIGGGDGCSTPASFPLDAPAGPYGSSLSVFDGSDPNGIWKLYVIDDTGGDDAGSITGWSLDISATPAADTTPPTVTDTTPDGTVSRTTTVTATFDEKVQNVTPSTFILERQIAVKKATPKYVLVDATVKLSDDGLSAVLDPVQDLPKGNYRATITTDVTDVADPANALEEPEVWTFTVAN